MKEFKLIIAGGRDFVDYEKGSTEIIKLCVDGELKEFAVSIVSGMARGADSIGWAFARQHNVKLYEMPANWKLWGKRAGFIRNHEMGDFADGLLAFWDGKSRGTKDMIEYMHTLGKPYRVVMY